MNCRCYEKPYCYACGRNHCYHGVTLACIRECDDCGTRWLKDNLIHPLGDDRYVCKNCYQDNKVKEVIK